MLPNTLKKGGSRLGRFRGKCSGFIAFSRQIEASVDVASDVRKYRERVGAFVERIVPYQPILCVVAEFLNHSGTRDTEIAAGCDDDDYDVQISLAVSDIYLSESTKLEPICSLNPRLAREEILKLISSHDAFGLLISTQLLQNQERRGEESSGFKPDLLELLIPDVSKGPTCVWEHNKTTQWAIDQIQQNHRSSYDDNSKIITRYSRHCVCL